MIDAVALVDIEQSQQWSNAMQPGLFIHIVHTVFIPLQPFYGVWSQYVGGFHETVHFSILLAATRSSPLD